MIISLSFRSSLLFLFMWVNKARCFLPSQHKVRSAFFLPYSTPSARFSSTMNEVGEGDSPMKEETSFPKVTLKRNRQSRSFRDGSQLVFSGSVSNAPKSLKLADLVLIDVPVSSDSNNENNMLIGVGVYNPSSMYRVRILCHSLLNAKLKFEKMDPHAALVMILKMQFKKALETRRAMGFPSCETNTYRLINGEGDGISGLAVDVVGGDIAVIMSSAAWCQVHKSTILECLQEVLPEHELIWKTTPSRLRQDGYTMKEDEEEMDELEDVAPVIATENGLKYRTFPHKKGQKTSVYCDQRDNRLDIAKMCEGKRVLDLCCYHGGFSLNAANQKAAEVTGVDSSQDAIDTSIENAKLNNFEDCIDFVKSDISTYMKSCSEKYDVIVLDPRKCYMWLRSFDRSRSCV
jgi:23S rRNA G2069 N7-methylase RlmK/C1962 C5-methylase RlmI